MAQKKILPDPNKQSAKDEGVYTLHNPFFEDGFGKYESKEFKDSFKMRKARYELAVKFVDWAFGKTICKEPKLRKLKMSAEGDSIKFFVDRLKEHCLQELWFEVLNSFYFKNPKLSQDELTMLETSIEEGTGLCPQLLAEETKYPITYGD